MNLAQMAKSYTALDIFESAEACLRAARILNRKSNRRRESIAQAPVAFMLAFSLELYLKALVALEIGVEKVKGVHEVDDLFKDLHSTSQDEIRGLFRRIIAGPVYLQWKDTLTLSGHGHHFVDDPDEVLRQCRKSFVKIRYVYEYREDAIWNGSAMLEAVREFMIRRYPSCAVRKLPIRH